MRDPKRIAPIVQKLQEVWEKNPDLRLGQLLIAVDPRPITTMKVFGLDDHAWLECLEKFEEERQ